MTKIIFTVAEQKVIRDAALTVWDSIGSDILAAIEEEGEEPEMSREDVVEVVCDAGRLEEEIWQRGKIGRTANRAKMLPSDAQKLAEKIRNAGPDLEKLVTSAFRHKVYGM